MDVRRTSSVNIPAAGCYGMKVNPERRPGHVPRRTRALRRRTRCGRRGRATVLDGGGSDDGDVGDDGVDGDGVDVVGVDVLVEVSGGRTTVRFRLIDARPSPPPVTSS